MTFDIRQYVIEANDSLNEAFTSSDIKLLGDKLRTEHSQARRKQIKDLMARLKSGPGPFTKKDGELVYRLASTTNAAGTSDQLHNLKRRLDAAV